MCFEVLGASLLHLLKATSYRGLPLPEVCPRRIPRAFPAPSLHFLESLPCTFLQPSPCTFPAPSLQVRRLSRDLLAALAAIHAEGAARLRTERRASRERRLLTPPSPPSFPLCGRHHPH